MSDMHAGNLPSSPAGDDSAFAVDTSGIELDSSALGGGGGGGSRQRIMIVVLVVLAVALIGYVGFKLLHKSSTSSSGASTTSTPGATTPGSRGTTPGGSPGPASGITGNQAQGSSNSPAASASGPEIGPVQVYASRDPFVPVALPILSGTADLFGATLQVTTTTSASTATIAPSATTTPGGGSASTTTQAGAPAGPPPSQTHVFDLVSVFTSNGQPTANVTVDGQASQVIEGEVFDGNFTVVALNVATSCGTFLYADYEFQLCQGQQATV